MKKINIVIIVIVSLIIIDTMQAHFFEHSPLISWKELQNDQDSWVDRGIIIDTFYCVKEKDILKINWKLKFSKYECPIDDFDLQDFKNLNANDFGVTVHSSTTRDKIHIFNFENINYYYGNTKFRLDYDVPIKIDGRNTFNRYTFQELVEKKVIKLNTFLNQAKDKKEYEEATIYSFILYKVIACKENNEIIEIIIGDTELSEEDINMCGI